MGNGMRVAMLALVLALLGAGAWAQEKAPRFELGMTVQAVLQLLGKPSDYYPPDQDGKALLHYNRATVTVVKGIVTGWRNFDENTPVWAEGEPTIHLGSTGDEVMQTLGFPPNALRYTGMVLGRKPVGDEEWTYSVGTLIFKDGVVVGWRNVNHPAIALGPRVDGVREPDLGGTAREVIAALGTPPTLTCYAASGDQLWAYPHEQVLMRDGRVVWKGVPQPRTKAEMPPIRTEAPAATGDNGTAAAPEEDKGFINDPLFPQFRLQYDRIMDRLRTNTPRIVDTAGYRAMQDCLSQRPWWAIQAQADTDPDYAKGVDAIEEAFNKFLDDQEKRKN